MFKAIIKNEVDDAMYELRKKILEDIRGEIKEIAREVCLEAVEEMFSDEKDVRLNRSIFGYENLITIGGEFKERAIKAIDLHASEKAEFHAKREIRGEEFIDAVIERINRKQLGR